METEPLSSDAYYLLNTDGGMINTGQRRHEDPPGEAAVAVVLSQIRNRREHVIDGFSGAIGPATNDVAEYRALIEGLIYARRRGARKIRAYMDSEFVVEQVNDRAKVHQKDLAPLHSEVARLASEFAPGVGFRLSWVPRERNETADALVQAILYG
jgi:ribonuclease HI